MPLKYFLSRTCAGPGRLCGYDFMTFPGTSYKTILNFVCGIDMSNDYPVESIKFMFIKNYWLRSLGNAIEILFVKNLSRVGTT